MVSSSEAVSSPRPSDLRRHGAYVLTWLIAHTGNQMMPAFYLILVGLLGLGTMLTVKETRGIDLLRDDVALAQKSRAATVSPTANVYPGRRYDPESPFATSQYHSGLLCELQHGST